MSEITKELLYTGKAKDVYKTENESLGMISLLLMVVEKIPYQKKGNIMH